MKFTILNGSPKGDLSITMQYIKYIENNFPEHDYEIFDISEKIKAIEKNSEMYDKIINSVSQSDSVIWAFPVYYYLVPYQYKRFIELVFEKGSREAFNGKHAIVITTSIHFFDHTAHNYVHAIWDDLEMKYSGFFSADMYDLLDERKRDNLLIFMKNFITSVMSHLLSRNINDMISS